jgi:hypothetical protein
MSHAEDSFRGGADPVPPGFLERAKEVFNRPYEITGDTEDDFVQALRTLQRFVPIAAGVRVVYPGSKTHVGVARVFGKDAVMHVDTNSRAVECLLAHGYQAEVASLEDYTPPAPYDVMVGMNLPDTTAAQHLGSLVRPGGLVVVNNATGWARDLAVNNRARLYSAIFPAYDGDDSRYAIAGLLPADATACTPAYYRMDPPGPADGPGPGILEDQVALYPQGLFVFRMAEAA